jgi:hypothetical protein
LNAGLAEKNVYQVSDAVLFATGCKLIYDVLTA